MTLSHLINSASALFLDFDGTLVDIAPEPELVVVPADLVGALTSLHGYLEGALALVSGRPIAQVDAFLSPLRLPTAGEHGAERRNRAGEVTLQPALPLDEVKQAASRLCAQHPGLRLEIKRGSVALHYRLAPALEDACLTTMQAAVDASPGLVLLRGKMVAEAKPASTGKGQAIAAFLEEPAFRGRLPVFIGDDTTDEDGFVVVQAAGGTGIKVGPGPTAASQRLPDPASVRQLLLQALAMHVPGWDAR